MQEIVPSTTSPLSALEEPLKLKYYKENPQGCPSIEALSPPKPDAKPFDSYTAEERKKIVFWIKLVEKWQTYRNKAPNKTAVDAQFVAAIKLDNPDLALSDDTLYRKLKVIKNNDLNGLIDKRGKSQKGKTSIQPVMWDTFQFYFLDEAKHSLLKCHQYMTMSIKETNPELLDDIPSPSSFRRRVINEMPVTLQTMGRDGLKQYRDECGLYIRRVYEEMMSNEWWIGDTHTIDVQSQSDDGSIHRLYLSAFMDARSGVFVGWHISTSPSSQTTLCALRHAIKRNGIPYNIYVDNGREFLTHDVGGLGHRKRKAKEGTEEEYAPPPIFKRLGIEMTNALVKNARAKTIERRFRDFKEQISKAFSTYTGGNIIERPECLKARIKNGEIVIDAELIDTVNALMEYNLNYEPYGGSVGEDQNRRKIDVYNEYLKVKRVASENESVRPERY